MKPISKGYKATIFALEGLFEDEHGGCDQLTCSMSVCFNDGYTLWAIHCFESCGAASDEFLQLYATLPKRFFKDAELERKAFVEATEHADCPHCNAVVWHTEYYADTIGCDSCAGKFKKGA